MSVVAMTVDKKVAVGCRLCFMKCSVKKSYGDRKQGVSALTFNNRLYVKLWGHIVKTAFKKEKWIQ